MTASSISMEDFNAEKKQQEASPIVAVEDSVPEFTLAQFMATFDAGDIQPGEVVIGELTTGECETLYKLTMRHDRIDEIQAELSAEALTDMAATLRQSKGQLTQDRMREIEKQVLSHKEEFEELHLLICEANYLQERLMYLVRSRLQHHDFAVFIRKRKSVVAGLRKW